MLQNGLVVAKRGSEEWGRVVVPESLRAHVIAMHHNADFAGHQGEKRTLLQIAGTFYWPGMGRDVAKWVKACLACRKRKTPRPMRSGITEAALATYPNETVAIDILGPFPRSERGNVVVLTMIDTFTRWPVAIPLKDKSSASIAEAIYKFWICEKSVPLKIISDQAREFISKGIKQLAQQMGTQMITTSGYNPTGNSSVERFHRYLNSSLSIVFEKVRANWDDYLPSVLFSYRSSTNDTTGHSPFYLETGREPQLPLSNLFPYLRRREERKEGFVQSICDRLEFAFKRSRDLQAIAAEKNKARKPEQTKPNFAPGDLLLLQARSAKEGRLEERDEEGKHIPIPTKLQNPFTGPFRMIRWDGERHCVIETEGGETTHNVNRLVKYHTWEGMDTSAIRTREPAPPPREAPPKPGEIVVFRTSYSDTHHCLFGVGRVIQVIGPNDIHFQWLGNRPAAEASKPFEPGWVDTRDNKGYYKSKPNHPSHPPWTNRDTCTEITTECIILRGADMLRSDNKFTAAARAKIEASVGESISWGS